MSEIQEPPAAQFSKNLIENKCSMNNTSVFFKKQSFCRFGKIFVFVTPPGEISNDFPSLNFYIGD